MTPEMTFWLVMLIGGALTFLLRYAFIAWWGRFSLPNGLRRALRFVPVAVLVAIIVPDTVLLDGQLALHAQNPRLIAALVAVGVAALTRNMFLTIGAGFGVLLLMMNWSALGL